MRLDVSVELNLKTNEAKETVERAARMAMRDTVVDVAHDAVEGSPYLTGNNRRSIQYEVGPGGEVAKEDLTGAVFSTSGYGGYLETGTVKMAARPYFRPALRNFTAQKFAEKVKGYLK
uniref:Putative tail protein n=1 Tax=viral metagenome TaxID=1070528 RepID=A0A6M3IWR4_9ZZZZ